MSKGVSINTCRRESKKIGERWSTAPLR